MSVPISIEYLGNLHCRALHEPSGKTLLTDAPVDNGGLGEEFSPTDLVGTALGTCFLTVMGLVAQRSGIDLQGAKVRVEKSMTADPVRRIGSLKVVVLLPPSLSISPTDRNKLERAVQSCPVKQSLHPDVEVEVLFSA